jgi:acetyltransferase-like isoleucine patch superfamily enzyme
MLRIIKKVANNVYRQAFCKVNPLAYGRSLGVTIGEGTKFYGPNPHMFNTEPWIITIGKNCHITADVLFVTHDGGTLIIEEFANSFILTGPITVGDNTYIGTRTTVLPGVKIGNNCIIGAGSVVAKDIPDNSVAVGVPAKVVNTIEGYSEKIRSVMSGENPRYYSSLEEVRNDDPKGRFNKYNKPQKQAVH